VVRSVICRGGAWSRTRPWRSQLERAWLLRAIPLRLGDASARTVSQPLALLVFFIAALAWLAPAAHAATTAALPPTYDYDHPAAFVHDADSGPHRGAGPAGLDRTRLHSDLKSFPSVTHAGVAAEGGANAIVDTNAVFNRAGVEAALRSGETPVVTQTTRAELANLVASGRVGMPRYAGELRTIRDVMDVDLRINIRGAMRPGQRGLFAMELSGLLPYAPDHGLQERATAV
jgi:hypothetical protein